MINDILTVVVLEENRLHESNHAKGLVVDRKELKRLHARVHEIKQDIKAEAHVSIEKSCIVFAYTLLCVAHKCVGLSQVCSNACMDERTGASNQVIPTCERIILYSLWYFM